MVGRRIPGKKTTSELFAEIEEALNDKNYVFSDHAEKRSKSRKNVNDLEVVRILKSKDKRHEASKDKFEKGNADWNYHIRGKNSDGDRVRIAISFDSEMIIITVINLDEDDYE